MPDAVDPFATATEQLTALRARGMEQAPIRFAGLVGCEWGGLTPPPGSWEH